MELALAKQEMVNNTLVCGYYDGKEPWFTRTQIGQALEYADPQKAILLIHKKHKERLDQFSMGYQFDTPAGKREGYAYNLHGVFEICRWSRQPKADMVMDRLYDMAIQIMREGLPVKPTPRPVEEKRSVPKLKEPEADWAAVAMLNLNKWKYTRNEYHAQLVKILGSDMASIRNEMKLYDMVMGQRRS